MTADQEGVHAALLDVADVVEPARLLRGCRWRRRRRLTSSTPAAGRGGHHDRHAVSSAGMRATGFMALAPDVGRAGGRGGAGGSRLYGPH
jgi:hypothetical protein